MPTTGQGRTQEQFSIQSIHDDMVAMASTFESLDLIDRIEHIRTWIEKYIRLANQRDLTAFSRRAERTEGGGEEGQAKDRLIELRNLTKGGDSNEAEKYVDEYINCLLVMADVKPEPSEVPIFIHRLLTHGAQIIPAYSNLNPKALVILMWMEINRNWSRKTEEKSWEFYNQFYHRVWEALSYVASYFMIHPNQLMTKELLEWAYLRENQSPTDAPAAAAAAEDSAL